MPESSAFGIPIHQPHQPHFPMILLLIIGSLVSAIIDILLKRRNGFTTEEQALLQSNSINEDELRELRKNLSNFR